MGKWTLEIIEVRVPEHGLVVPRQAVVTGRALEEAVSRFIARKLSCACFQRQEEIWEVYSTQDL